MFQWNDLCSSVLRIIFIFFPAQLPQFSLFFWLCVQKNFLTASYFAWCLLFKKKIKSLRHAKACGAPFFELKYTHFQPFSNSSGTSLCFPLSGWTGSLSFAASSSLCPPLRSFLGQYLWGQQTYNSPFFLLLIRFILSWTLCERWDRRSPAVHFTQFQLNPIRRIGFGRSGMNLGFTIWNHISFSFSESLGE